MEMPSEKLAAQILDRLIEEGLVRETQRARFLPQLAGGTLRGDDWKMEIDLAQQREEADE